MTPAFRVAVVGNGPVGQTTALLLARWGVPSVLLDSRAERDPVGSKAICQQRDVLDIWDSVGGGRIAAEGLTWTTARTFFRDRELHSWSFVDRGCSPLPAFVNIGQDRTEALLDELITRQPLIEVRWGHEVSALTQSTGAVTLTCLTASGAGSESVDYAVVAAGAHAGGLREALGVRFTGESFDDRFLICDIRADLPAWESERRFYFDPPWNPNRQVLIHPTPGGVFRIDWQVPADFDLEAEEAGGGLDRRIRLIVGDRPYQVLWKTVYRFHSRIVDRMRVGRVLLAGDAAHLVAPFGARGLNSGVADAENAAWKLAAVLHGWAPEALLDSYHDERHAAAAENLEITGSTMGFLVPRDAAGWARRRALLEAAQRDPACRDEIDSGRFAEPFWYVESPLTTPDPTRPFAGRPAKGHAPSAAPGVLVPDVPVSDPVAPEVTRFRQLVRAGLLVLATDGVDVAALAPAVKEAVEAPTRVLAVADLGGGADVVAALDARPNEAWVIRPDGHVAAVIRHGDPARVRAALRRALAAAGEPAVAVLLSALVDDAGLFPPEELDMAAALARHRAARRNPVVTGRFLCPAARLAECARALTPGKGLALGLICSLEPDGLRDALDAVAAQPALTPASVEGVLPTDRSALTDRSHAVPHYVELRPDAELDATLSRLAEHGLRAKLRCGGVRRELFPGVAEVAAFVHACVRHGVPFKATAGLHHAVAHHDPRTGFDHHGFLNLALAAARAVAGAAPEAIAEVLAVTDPAPLVAEVRNLTVDQARRARAAFVCYGSCSTTEPLDDLVALGLLEEC